MAHPLVVGGRYNLKMWRVAASKSVLNKQLWTSSKVWSSSLGVGEGLTTSHCKIPAWYEMLHRASEMDGIGLRIVTSDRSL
jgi:hypothetical protein